MDEAALKKLIDCLNKQSDALHGRDHFWSTCLIVGCAFEVIFVCHEYLEGRNDWYKARTSGFLSFPEKPSIKWLILEMLGVILVIAGIGGELRVSILAGRLETRLREANGNLVLLLEDKTKVLDNSTQQLKTDADTERGKTAIALQKAGEANRAAEAEKLARVQLEEQIEPRKLLQPDRIAIGDDLKKFAPNFKGRPIKISSQVGDAEGLLFALAIGDILDRAGIPSDSTGVGRMLSVGGLQFGVSVKGTSRDGEFVKSLVGDIQKRSIGGIRGDWNPTFTDCTIFVGVKPIKDMQKLLDVELK